MDSQRLLEIRPADLNAVAVTDLAAILEVAATYDSQETNIRLEGSLAPRGENA